MCESSFGWVSWRNRWLFFFLWLFHSHLYFRSVMEKWAKSRRLRWTAGATGNGTDSFTLNRASLWSLSDVRRIKVIAQEFPLLSSIVALPTVLFFRVHECAETQRVFFSEFLNEWFPACAFLKLSFEIPGSFFAGTGHQKRIHNSKNIQWFRVWDLDRVLIGSVRGRKMSGQISDCSMWPCSTPGAPRTSYWYRIDWLSINIWGASRPADVSILPPCWLKSGTEVVPVGDSLGIWGCETQIHAGRPPWEFLFFREGGCRLAICFNSAIFFKFSSNIQCKSEKNNVPEFRIQTSFLPVLLPYKM